MHPVIENFMERPLSQRVGAWIASLLLISFVFYQYFYKARAEQADELEKKIETLNSKIIENQRIAKNLEKFRQEVRELEVKLKIALQELPDKREIPELLSSISNLARDAGLEVSSFKPNPEMNKDFYAEVPVSISVEGTYHQVATFFDEVGKLPRIVTITHIAVHDPNITDAKVLVKSDCVATTFRYLDESERLEKANTSDQKKRRKK